MDLDAQGLALQARAIAAGAAAALADKPVSNVSPANMATWNRAKARVRAGVADAVVAFVGDSTTVGHGAGDNPTSNFTNARFRSMPARVAAQLAAQGLPAVQEAVFGGNQIDANNATIASYPLYNPQVTIASAAKADWYLATLATLGGYMLTNDTGSGAWTLTPANPFDAVDIYYLRAFSTGGLTVDIGGATLATIDCTAGAVTGGTIVKATVPTGAVAATGTIRIRRSGTGSVRLIGVVPRHSGVRRVQALNLGWEGAQTGDWASASASATYPASVVLGASYSPSAALAALAPDLTVIKLGANDLSHATPIATSQANLQTIIAAAKAGGGSCILVTPTPQSPARDPAGLTPAYAVMVRRLATTSGCGLVDLGARYIGWASANGLGYFADDVHSLPIGYANEGDVIARALFDS